MEGSKHTTPLVLVVERTEEYMEEEIGKMEVKDDTQSVGSFSSTVTGAETPDAIDLLKQQNKDSKEKEQRIAPDTLLGTSHMYVIGMGTQDKAKVTLQQEELEDGVVGLMTHLEPFLTALRKRRMTEIGVAARHNTVAVEEKEKRRQKKREKQDKKKEK